MTDHTSNALPPPIPQPTFAQDFVQGLKRLGFALFKLGLVLVALAVLFGKSGSESRYEPATSTETPLAFGHFPDIMDAAKNNEARFERDYKGLLLSVNLPFHSSNTTLGSRQVWFGDHKIVCHMSEAMYFKTSNWNKGQIISVTGRMRSVGFMGSLSLDNCQFD